MSGPDFKQLRLKLHRALAEIEDGGHPNGYLLVTPDQADLLLMLLKDERTCGPTRVECFEQLLPLLTRWKAGEMVDLLTNRMLARQPGSPGYAALHGLLAGGQA